MTIPLRGEEFTGIWKVESSDGYVIKNGRLGVVGWTPDPHVYKPQNHPELPFEIAKLADATEDEILRFATQWGLLGYYELGSAKRDKVVLALGPSFKVERIEADEPLDWIRMNGRRFWLCVRLADGIVNEEEESLAGLLRQFFEMEDAADKGGRARLAWEASIGLRFLAEEENLGPRPVERAIRTRTLELARSMFENLVDVGMEGIEPRITFDGGPTITFHFDAMVQIAYLHLARLIVEKGRVEYCAECGKPFRKTDARQRFCPRGQFESESRCGYKHRYAKWMGAKPDRRRKGGRE